MSEHLKHLKKLSTIRSGKNSKFLTPAVYSGGWCPMRVACNIVEDIEGVSYLMVGMPECATHSRGMNSLPEGPNGELRWLYVLDANEVIFGCRNGVIEALKEMDAAGAKAILMIATCVTDLIGEDFEGIISEVQPKMNARLSYVTLGQFKNFGSGIGTWKVAEALGEFMLPREKKEKVANLLFLEPWRTKGSPLELPLIIDALERRGVTVRKIAAGATLEDYMDAPDTALNLVTTSYTQPLAAKMQDRFGTPYSPLHNAFTVEDIDKVYKEIEDILGISLEGEFDGWRKKAVELEERAKKELGGKTFVMITEVDMPVALTKYLVGFGMKPLLINVDDIHNEDIGFAKEMKAEGIDPPACRIMYIEKDLEIVRELQPDIVFGYVDKPVTDIKLAEEMGDFFGITGYERTVGILSRIFTVLETGKMGERLDIYGPAPL